MLPESYIAALKQHASLLLEAGEETKLIKPSEVIRRAIAHYLHLTDAIVTEPPDDEP